MFVVIRDNMIMNIAGAAFPPPYIKERNKGYNMDLKKALVESVRKKCSGSLHIKVEQFIKAPQMEGNASPFSVITLRNGAIGISYNLFHRDSLEMERYMCWDENTIIGKEAQVVMEQFLSDDDLEKTVGLAVINALSQEYMRKHPESYHPDFETIVEEIQPWQGRKP